MAVSYNAQRGVWQVNGQGAYSTQQEAQAADGGAAAVSTGGAAQADFSGEGTAAAPAAAPAAPPPDPQAAAAAKVRADAQRTSGYNAGYDRTANQSSTPQQQATAYGHGNIGGVSGAYNATRAGFMTPTEDERRAAAVPNSAPVVAPQYGGASTAPGGPVGAPMVTVDYSRYDQAAQGYDRAVQTFQSELDRLSGVDPFGNQAFLRKATDRAAAQAGGLAAGGLSTATARAGNMRQAQGVQASLAAQGIEQQAVQRNADENQAAQLRLGAASGLSGVLGQKAQNEVELAKLQTSTMATNLDAMMKKYGIDAQLDQQDIESLRQVALGYAQVDANRYATDKQYQESVDADLTKRYGIDAEKAVALKKIAEDGKFTFKDLVMGAMGAAGGVAGGLAKSDRRAKFDVHDPDLRDLEDFLGRTKGKLYRYKEPNRPGQRSGLNFGPMAQDLQKSKIGKTLVVEGKDGLYVDTGRLALADHAALAALAAEVKALKGGKS